MAARRGFAGDGVLRDCSLEDGPRLPDSLPLSASDRDSPSDSPNEDAASDNLFRKPDAARRAGIAVTLLVSPSADTPAVDDAVKVIGVEDDAASDGEDIAARKGMGFQSPASYG